MIVDDGAPPPSLPQHQAEGRPLWTGGYFGLPPSKLSPFYYALPLMGYLDGGGHFPIGTSQKIRDALAGGLPADTGFGLTIYDNVDPGCSPKGKNTLNMIVPQGYDFWKTYEEAYRDRLRNLLPEGEQAAGDESAPALCHRQRPLTRRLRI